MSRLIRGIVLTTLVVAATAPRAHAYSYCGGWFSDNAVMDVYPKPLDTWAQPAEDQLYEWDVIQGDGSRPFRKLTTPVDQLGPGDGYNTIGFLTEANLIARFGLDFSDAVGWTVSSSSGGCTQFTESDVILNADHSYSLSPADEYWFQSTVVHEAGHVLGFEHYNGFFSVMNSGVNKWLRGETLYMDDREGFRNYYAGRYALPSETDIVVYEKWFDGSSPQWMTLSNTTVAPGGQVTLQGVTVENLGTTNFGALHAGVYLSTNDVISTFDTYLGGVSWTQFNRYTYSTFDPTVTIPVGTPSGTYYLGVIIDDDDQYSESNEGNNAITAVDGTPFAEPIFVTGGATNPPTTTTTSTQPTPTTTSTTLPPQCPGGFQCVNGACKPNRVPIPQCARACSAQITSCSTSCVAIGKKTPKKCVKSCRKSIVSQCKRKHSCPALVGTLLPASCSP